MTTAVKMNKKLPTLFLCAALLLVASSPAAAQGMTMLNPIKPSYDVLGFAYKPPVGDGWRELELAANVLRLVYAEETSDGKITMRVEFAAEAHEIPPPSPVSSSRALAKVSFDQRRKERESTLIAESQIELVAGTDDIYTFTFVSRVGENDYIEVFYVNLAPDQSRYLAAKLATKDADYDTQPYYMPLIESLKSIQFATAAKPELEQQKKDDDTPAMPEAAGGS